MTLDVTDACRDIHPTYRAAARAIASCNPFVMVTVLGNNGLPGTGNLLLSPAAASFSAMLQWWAESAD